jgi:hypothetical protein
VIFRSPEPPHSGPKPGGALGGMLTRERPAQQAAEPCVHASAVSVMTRPTRDWIRVLLNLASMSTGPRDLGTRQYRVGYDAMSQHLTNINTTHLPHPHSMAARTGRRSARCTIQCERRVSLKITIDNVIITGSSAALPLSFLLNPTFRSRPVTAHKIEL